MPDETQEWLAPLICRRRDAQGALDTHAAENPNDVSGRAALAARVKAAQGRIDQAMKDRDSAERLAAIWIERERKMRAAGPMGPLSGTPASEAVKRCRLDLQWQFSLVRRVGPGPMPEAESEEYLAREMKARGGREEQL